MNRAASIGGLFLIALVGPTNLRAWRKSSKMKRKS